MTGHEAMQTSSPNYEEHRMNTATERAKPARSTEQHEVVPESSGQQQCPGAAHLELLKAKTELLEQQLLKYGLSRKALLSEG